MKESNKKEFVAEFVTGGRTESYVIKAETHEEALAIAQKRAKFELSHLYKVEETKF